MRAQFLTSFIIFLIVTTGFSKDPDFEWAYGFGGSLSDEAKDLTTDIYGNVYKVGSFTGTVDFDPGTGTTNLTSFGLNDIFITKLDSSGNLIWVNGIGGTGSDNAYAVTTDAQGNVYISGGFEGSVDFDPSTGITTLVSNGKADMFFMKMDSNGNFLWANSAGDVQDDYGTSISISSNGNVYSTGVFEGIVDFDPSASILNLASNGNTDVFVTKHDANGNIIWAKGFGANFDDRVSSIVCDANEDIYFIGEFSGTVDFNPGSGTANKTTAGGYDIFVNKLDSAGNHVWVNTFGSTATDYGYGIALDNAGNIIITGSFRGTVDFDPSNGTTNLSSTTSSYADIYVSKYTSSGSLLWARNFGGSSNDAGVAITTDTEGNIYTTGWFLGVVDFDPGSGVKNISTKGESDCFVQKLDTSGNLLWVITTGGTKEDKPIGVATYSHNNVYVAGNFINTSDFDPGPGVHNITSNGSRDAFLFRLSSPIIMSLQGQINVACHGDSTGSATVVVKDGFKDFDYVWSNGQSFLNSSSNSNTIAGLPAGTYSVIVTDTHGDTSMTSVTITEPALLQVSANVVSNASCMTSTDGSGTALVTGGVAPYSYLWSNGQVTKDLTGVEIADYSVTITDANNCSVTSNSISIVSGDVTPPQVYTKNINLYLDSLGQVADIMPAQIDSGSTDNCTIVSYQLDSVSFDCSKLGANTVNLAVADSSGNSSSKSAIVTVLDTIKPIARAKNVTIQLNSAGYANIAPSDVDSGSTDNCSFVLSLSRWGFTCADVGTHFVKLGVTDLSGNSDTAIAVVTVVDTSTPNVVTQNRTYFLDPLGQVSGVSPLYINDGSSDNCAFSNLSFQLDKDSFDCTNIGANKVVLTVTDSSGNSDTASAIITILDITPPTVVTKNVTIYLDSLGQAELIPSQVDSASFDNCSIDTMYTSSANFDCSNVGLNTVLLTVKDGQGNSDSASAMVTVLDTNTQLIFANYTMVMPTCNSSNDGAINVTVGGAGPYTYLWSNGSNSQNLTNLTAGTYALTITNPNGCTQTDSIVLNEPDTLKAHFVSVSPLCNGTSTGSLSVTATGGTSPYSYLWSNGVTQSSNNFIGAGSYAVSITDAKGCVVTDSILLTEPIPLTAIVAASTLSCENDSNGVAQVFAWGGSGPLSYLWSNGLSTDSIGGLTAGNHQVTITDTNNCSIVKTFNTNFLNSNPIVNIGPDSTYNVVTTVTLDAKNPGLTYLWSTGDTTQTVNILLSSDSLVWVQVTNSVGCSSTDTVLLTLDLNVGLAESEKGGIKVFPNPANENIYIELEDSQASEMNIIVMDAKGATVKSLQFNQPQSGERYTIDASAFNAGLYIVHITMDESHHVYKINKTEGVN